MFGIAGTVELGTICPGTGTWNRLQDGNVSGVQHGARERVLGACRSVTEEHQCKRKGIYVH